VSGSLLLHCCCGPCTLFPAGVLREGGEDLVGFFCNPNIHPFREYEKRVEAMEQVAACLDMAILWDRKGYDLDGWFAGLSGETSHPARCIACYRTRLRRTAETAAAHGYRRFTTTLLYSRYQQHGAIVEVCRELALAYGLEFVYHDFREGWTEGIEMAKELGIYRQPYCGCIFSERERYAGRERRLRERLAKEVR